MGGEEKHVELKDEEMGTGAPHLPQVYNLGEAGVLWSHSGPGYSGRLTVHRVSAPQMSTGIPLEVLLADFIQLTLEQHVSEVYPLTCGFFFDKCSAVL